MDIRLIREQHDPDGYGPGNGMAALQAGLRRVAKKRGLGWFHIGGEPSEHELPWFWHWDDGRTAARWRGQFLHGPNILFSDSSAPGRGGRHERRLLEKPAKVIFTESEWYRNLILGNLRSNTPVEVWPYPIDPMPQRPRPAALDLLIFLKTDPASSNTAIIAGNIFSKLRPVPARACTFRAMTAAPSR
jgi:hypothetical protein